MADDKEKKQEPWWIATLGGLLLLGGSVWVYQDLTQFEAEGGTRRMKWIPAVLYNNLGKWGVVGLLAAGGLGATLHGLSQLKNKLSAGGSGRLPSGKKKRVKSSDADD